MYVSAKFTLLNATDIHNWPQQPFSQYYGLASYATQVVSINFIHECRRGVVVLLISLSEKSIGLRELL